MSPRNYTAEAETRRDERARHARYLKQTGGQRGRAVMHEPIAEQIAGGPISAQPLPTADTWLKSHGARLDIDAAKRRRYAAAFEELIEAGVQTDDTLEYAFLLAREYLEQTGADFLGTAEVCERYGGMHRQTTGQPAAAGQIPGALPNP
ncbi:MAG: hypothetical protein C4558_07505 [Dehalococcoidia bacterium]|nr:MAG: hypothetical protein C4558_07505 [Dehalococcoidia bacterium]